jgi:hypothetical protein
LGSARIGLGEAITARTNAEEEEAEARGNTGVFGLRTAEHFSVGAKTRLVSTARPSTLVGARERKGSIF